MTFVFKNEGPDHMTTQKLLETLITSIFHKFQLFFILYVKFDKVFDCSPLLIKQRFIIAELLLVLFELCTEFGYHFLKHFRVFNLLLINETRLYWLVDAWPRRKSSNH